MVKRKTLGLAYITREVIQEGETFSFQSCERYSSLERTPIQWGRKKGHTYFKLHYCPNYPSFESSQNVLLIMGAKRPDYQELNRPQIKLGQFGEGEETLFLSLNIENMSEYDHYRRGREEGKRLNVITRKLEDFYEQIPGRGGKATTTKEFISTANGALTYQKDFYDDLRDIYIDQDTIPFAALKRERVGWVEGNEFQEGYPEFEFVAYEYDGTNWGNVLKDFGKRGFHFRINGKIQTLKLHDIVLKIQERENPCKKCLSEQLEKEGYNYELIRLPGYPNKGLVVGHIGPCSVQYGFDEPPKQKPNIVYEVEMKPAETSVEIVGVRELPFSNVTHISPVSSRKVNDTLLEWANNPETNPYTRSTNWIYRAGESK
ncbi:MAG: hypothetical protein WCI72_02610 [archaeon]